MENRIEIILKSLGDTDAGFIKEASDTGRKLQVGQTEFIKASGYSSEKEYKKEMAARGEFTYHYHLCCPSNEVFKEQITELGQRLFDKKLRLDRFGVSVDYAMALPEEMRKENRKGDALYFASQSEWNILGSSAYMQPHLGDQMIGSPASLDNVRHALRAGVTTIGNISQFFGWDYPEYQDVEERTKNTLRAIAVMAEHAEEGCLIHSNLDDGYGDAAKDLGLLIGCALLEQYIVEDLMYAKVAHSYGDMFHSPFKRLVFLSALHKIHRGDLIGSMIFTNKLGRNQKEIRLNTSHLSECLLYDMAGQAIYKTGHAVTTMANQGLTTKVTVEEIVDTLGYAKELEAYIPAIVETIDIEKIDRAAESVVRRGNRFYESVLEYFSRYIDIRNPYAMMLGIKKTGMKNLVREFAPPEDRDVIPCDYQIYQTHASIP